MKISEICKIEKTILADFLCSCNHTSYLVKNCYICTLFIISLKGKYMTFYPTFVVLHIITAGLWIANIIATPIFMKAIKKESGTPAESKLISLHLVFSNLLGSVGAMGLLITGVVLTSLNPGFGFFDFSANHWLATKQIIMVILLALIFAKLIPSAKKTRIALGKDSIVSDEAKSAFQQVNKVSLYINILVVLNLLFAVTHRFMG